MNLEQLANDVVLEMFEYLGGISTLRLFSQLNSRFDSLLVIYFRSHSLDFHGSSKDDFDLICRENLPSMVEHINALRLSDDNQNPDQINLFLSRGWTLNRFIHLRSITVTNVFSNELISQLVDQCRRIPFLARFELSECTLKYHRPTLQKILNHLWSMPKLIDCKLDWKILRLGSNMVIPTIRSKSLESVFISGFSLYFAELLRLFRCTPRLRQLTIWIADNSSVSRSFPSMITSLNIRVTDSRPMLVNLFKHLPNLVYLRIVSEHLTDSGDQWQQLIEGYLPRLKRFELQMHYSINRSSNVDDDIEGILDTYRTLFWLIDRRWLVRCCWDCFSEDKTSIFLHTLPYHWDFFPLRSNSLSPYAKSTCPSDHRFDSYTRVQKLHYDYSPLAGSYFSDLRFANVKHLEVEFPICDQIFLALPRLDQITSMHISNTTRVAPDLVQSQLQSIIDRTRRLHSISIGDLSSHNVQQILLGIKSDSIRCIDLGRSHDPLWPRCFSADDIEAFLASPLATMCATLSLVVDDRSVIPQLIDRMPNLKALKIEYQPANHVPPNRSQHIQFMVEGYSRDLIDETSPNEISRMWVR